MKSGHSRDLPLLTMFEYAQLSAQSEAGQDFSSLGTGEALTEPVGCSSRHELQYFETFCNSGIAKASRFGGTIHWAQFDLVKATGNTDGDGTSGPVCVSMVAVE